MERRHNDAEPLREDQKAHHFEFDLDRGIRLQVVEKLEASPPKPLLKGAGPQQSGIYALYHRDVLVYIGKASSGTTKSKRTLRTCLTEHTAKINASQNISLKHTLKIPSWDRLPACRQAEALNHCVSCGIP